MDLKPLVQDWSRFVWIVEERVVIVVKEDEELLEKKKITNEPILCNDIRATKEFKRVKHQFKLEQLESNPLIKSIIL